MDWIVASHSTSSAFAPEAMEHIAVCEGCRRLAGALNGGLTVSLPPENRMRQIGAIVLRDLTPVRPLAPERVFLAALAAIGLAIVAVGSAMLGIGGWRGLGPSQKCAVFVTLAASSGMLAVSLVRLIAPGSRYYISPARLLISILMLQAAVFASIFPWRHESEFVPNGMNCLRTGLVCAIPSAAFIWLLLRRGEISSYGLMGATAGGLAGMVSLAVLEVQCANGNALHILTSHIGMTLLSMAAGFAIGRMLKLCHNLFRRFDELQRVRVDSARLRRKGPSDDEN